MLPVGVDHSKNHGLLALAIGLYGILKGIPFTVLDNCSFRKTGQSEFQPDLSYYIGDRAQLIPAGTNIINIHAWHAKRTT
jgi:Uma2 family endonuclease